MTGSRSYTVGAAAVGVRNKGGYSITTGDHHGTGTTVVNPDGTSATRRYTPYDTERGGNGPWPNNHGFLNQPTDATDLTYLTNRYYGPLTGTFAAVDPLVVQTRQAYIYGNANPTMFADPNGLDAGIPGPNLPTLSDLNPFGGDDLEIIVDIATLPGKISAEATAALTRAAEVCADEGCSKNFTDPFSHSRAAQDQGGDFAYNSDGALRPAVDLISQLAVEGFIMAVFPPQSGVSTGDDVGRAAATTLDDAARAPAFVVDDVARSATNVDDAFVKPTTYLNRHGQLTNGYIHN